MAMLYEVLILSQVLRRAQAISDDTGLNIIQVIGMMLLASTATLELDVQREQVLSVREQYFASRTEDVDQFEDRGE
jgi:hypothetical protein